MPAETPLESTVEGYPSKYMLFVDAITAGTVLTSHYYFQTPIGWCTSCINPGAIQMPSLSWADVPQSPPFPSRPQYSLSS